MNILIVPDKFKGTLSASDAARAIRRGWKSSRRTDLFTVLPMSDGGDGFGAVMSRLIGAKSQRVKTINAAHQPIAAKWWWEPKQKIAVIESANVIGLAMLPPKKFHPTALDTFGLGTLLQAARSKGATTCIVGIGGSATNDGGFGVAQALGWEFLDKMGSEIHSWTRLSSLSQIRPPKEKLPFKKLIIAVDVGNPLLGKKGCSRVYGPQKGLQTSDIEPAERSLGQLARISAKEFERDLSKLPGAGAAGGLGFGLMTFAGGKLESGFEIFSRYSNLSNQIKNSDLIITGEGAIDDQTLMGKGVGQIALLCRQLKKPCIGLAGVVVNPAKTRKLFTTTASLTELADVSEAKSNPEKYLTQLAAEIARNSDSK